MLDEEFARQLESLGVLSEENSGHIEQGASPVLATPALAFAGGAALVGGAYALGNAIG
ncbi:hypothetical protein [Streptomyces sp. ALI-76-A]|jgi:hypothetical protein|uniref:hypothetical protein n=1 Tax=Streptomyces sp. ALI-76-A TaxID=3025736 RepID=UPI00256EDEB9|nr:hypothetical protein [Streptomyces sp. ALI-76-A]MDL5206012.1 hypothetical protein [Streptomyces sp. ALI-76-A]